MSDQPSVEERLRRLEDLEAINELLNQYSDRFDHRDLRGWSELFASDGEWHGERMHGVGGPQGVFEMMDSRFGGDRPHPGETHLVANPVIEIEGDEAHATSIGLVIYPDPDDNGVPTTRMVGFYVDDLVREDGEWRFKIRRDYLDIPPYLTETVLGPPTTWEV